ncbi:GspH/FimT family pseudopilin [Rhabdochromatium marinum]|uniref:GspH/FimT family pseudopilin n=1 Tax=Rhabdochromatium marinum TaxID=48729 RepID=UPI001905FB37|nr:GspH/FimT family pseudopilin [Rhabdochromatium marinum]MBK1647898.1 hypothetical protein [Rhabdochromatium marinum]
MAIAQHLKLNRARCQGVTLVELVMTLAIAAILLAIGVPSFQNITATNRIASLTNELRGALQLARSEAVKRGRTVTVCKSDDITDSTPTCNASANWQDGWVVFVDTNNDGSLDSGEIPLRLGQPSIGSAVITTSTRFNDFLRFQPDGRAQGADNFSNGSINVCIASNQRSIIINNIGRIKIETGTCT